MNPIEAVLESTERYLATVAALSDADLRAPSVLPGWSRGHVVAHVANHAQGTARALRGARTGAPVSVYDSQEARNDEIEQRAGGTAADLAGYSQLAALRLAGELRLMKALVTIERVPGGKTMSAPDVVDVRWREVEIHHADLGVGYSATDWPESFTTRLLEDTVEWRSGELDLTLHVRDQDRTLMIGKGGHGVAGTAAALTWWLVGRGDGRNLTSTRPLPMLAPWA